MSNRIIESKKYLPWVVRQSRDMQAICKVLDLLINDFKTNVDYWVNLIDFDRMSRPFIATIGIICWV